MPKSDKKALPDSFLDQNVVDINPTVIRETLEELTDGETRRKSGLRYISAILGDCVKAGTLAENPCARVQQPRRHEHVRVFFNHYHKAMTKREALPYWQVLPTGVEMPAISPVEEAPLPKESGAA